MTDAAFIILAGVLFVVLAFLAVLIRLVLKLQDVLKDAMDAIKQVAAASVSASNSTNALIEKHRSEMSHHFQLLNARAGFPNE